MSDSQSLSQDNPDQQPTDEADILQTSANLTQISEDKDATIQQDTDKTSKLTLNETDKETDNKTVQKEPSTTDNTEALNQQAQSSSAKKDLLEDSPEMSKPEIAKPEASKPETTKKEAVKVPSHIKLTGRLLNFTRLTLQGNQVDDLLEKVKTKLGKQRQSNLPVVVSCENELDLVTLWQGLWELGLQPIGIVTGVLDEQAKQNHIAIFPADGQRLDAKNTAKNEDKKSHTTQEDSKTSEKISQTAEPASLQNTSTTENDASLPTDKLNVDTAFQSQLEGDLIHNLILRSGQSINHVGGDLILTKGINAGAEAITDYSLHIYGKAEGRLVAGATGDTNARIFCLKFNPSLVSVAGTYCLKENIPPEFINQAVQVSFEEGKGLVFHLMT